MKQAPLKNKVQQMRKRGFTLIEVMAAATIMVVLIGSVLYAVGEVLKSWNDTSGKIQGYFEGDALADFMQQDLQAMLIKRDGKAWLQVAYPQDVGMLTGMSVGGMPIRPPQLMFFSPTYIRPRFDSTQMMNKSSDRKSIPGSVCAIKYQLSYKSPFKEGSSSSEAALTKEIACYGLYRGVIDSKSTFEEALGDAQGIAPDAEFALARFWSGTSTVLNDSGTYDRGADLKSWVLSPENFIAANLVDLQITFAIKYKREGAVVAEGKSAYSVAYIEPGTPFTVAEKIYIDGNVYERGQGGGKAPVSAKEVENGALSFAEISMTFMSDVGVNELRNMTTGDRRERFKELRQKHGITTTRKVQFLVEPSE